VKNSLIDEIDPETLASYHHLFLIKRQTIIEQWEKDHADSKNKR